MHSLPLTKHVRSGSADASLPAPRRNVRGAPTRERGGGKCKPDDVTGGRRRKRRGPAAPPHVRRDAADRVANLVEGAEISVLRRGEVEGAKIGVLRVAEAIGANNGVLRRAGSLV